MAITDGMAYCRSRCHTFSVPKARGDLFCPVNLLSATGINLRKNSENKSYSNFKSSILREKLQKKFENYPNLSETNTKSTGSISN
jgi:hypothetical protein